jgi:hypothetical protein
MDGSTLFKNTLIFSTILMLVSKSDVIGVINVIGVIGVIGYYRCY